MKDRIARFESLKETSSVPIKRSAEQEVIDESAEIIPRPDQTQVEEHISGRPTELAIQKEVGRSEGVIEEGEEEVETPSTPQVVQITQQREQIGKATTVESPPKSDALGKSIFEKILL